MVRNLLADVFFFCTKINVKTVQCRDRAFQPFIGSSER
jgi:hypothetical protein